ncbi:MAG: hypothetical protein J5589_13380 [Firmicutes bacterium]|nr:hypothetical protein [Bacillota bacterium]
MIKKHFWLSEEENQLLLGRAKRAGLTQSSLIRMLLKGLVPKNKPSEKLLRSMMEQIALVGQLKNLADKAELQGYGIAEQLRNITEKMIWNNLTIEEEIRVPEDRRDFWK